MRLLPFLLFIAVPLIELAILIKVGEIIGIGATILLVISTAIIGVSLLKRQGLAALSKARNTVETGEFPVESVVDGVCLIVAGAFLLTPGLLTDTLGFLLLVPGLRRGIARWIFDKLLAVGNVHFSTFGAGGPGGPSPHDGGSPGGGKVIEGEYEDVADAAPEQEPGKDDAAKRGSSPWRK